MNRFCSALFVFAIALSASCAFAAGDKNAPAAKEDPEVTKLKNDFVDAVRMIPSSTQAVLIGLAIAADEDEKIADQTQRVMTPDLLAKLDDAGVAFFKSADLVNVIKPLLTDEEKMRDPKVRAQAATLIADLRAQTTKISDDVDYLSDHLDMPDRVARWRKDAGPGVPPPAEQK